MNGKAILLLFVCFNIVSLAFTFSCVESGASCQSVGSPMLNWAFSVDSNTQLNETGGLSLNSTFEGETNALTQQKGGAQESSTIAFILDSLKMIVGFISLLTPLPMLAYVFAFGLPVWLSMMVVVPSIILYVIAIAEFVGGRQF